MDGEDDDASLAPSVMTLRSRSSILPNGQMAFDTALRVPVQKRYVRAIRHIDTGYKSWINGVCLTDRHCPIQIRAFGQDELRMRSCGVLGGSGNSIIFFDAELGTLVKSCHDLTSPILSMSMTAPSRKTKLAPLLATGLRDGRVILWDMQTASPLYESLSTIKHKAPIHACHICEGSRSLCILGTCDDARQHKPVVLCYNFELGKCEKALRDHSEGSRITAITTCHVKMVHSLILTAATDGWVFAYDVFTYEQTWSLRDGMIMLPSGLLVREQQHEAVVAELGLEGDEEEIGGPATSPGLCHSPEAGPEPGHSPPHPRPHHPHPETQLCIYAIAAIPGRVASRDSRNRPTPAVPSLVVAACRDGLVRVWNVSGPGNGSKQQRQDRQDRQQRQDRQDRADRATVAGPRKGFSEQKSQPQPQPQPQSPSRPQSQPHMSYSRRDAASHSHVHGHDPSTGHGRLLHRLYGHDRGSQVLCVAGIRTRTPGCVSGGEDRSGKFTYL